MSQDTSRIRRKPRPTQRRAAATAELAVCLPVILLIVLGAIEATSMTFLRQALVQSAYETAKVAVKARGSEAEGLLRGQEVLAARNVSNQTISFSADVESVDRGTPVTVTVTAPGDSNTILPFGPFSGRTVVATATMMKE